MTVKFTDQPWHVCMSNNATPCVMFGNDCALYEVGDSERLICWMPTEITKKFNSLQNAKLIAAAPDLFHALCDMVSDRNCLSDETVKRAIQALEKAGVQP